VVVPNPPRCSAWNNWGAVVDEFAGVLAGAGSALLPVLFGEGERCCWICPLAVRLLWPEADLPQDSEETL